MLILSDKFNQDTKLARFENLLKDSFISCNEAEGSMLGQPEAILEFITRLNKM